MRAQNTIQSSIWGAALIAANCRAVQRRGRAYPVRWQQAADHMRFVARREVEVQPLGVRLAPGEVLEVRWAPNETSYSLAVRSTRDNR
jgi:hypothetical protein